MEVILNEKQTKAKDLIVSWFNNEKNKKQCFVLTGYAGTGKTFLVSYVVNEVLRLNSDEVAYVAPTGKAACVLIQKGCYSATTIHKLIYNTVEKEFETELNGKKIKSKRTVFVRKPSIKNYKLIIVDETSMVEKKIMEDLLSFGIPLLCCGDLGQLPPINSSNDILKHPDINLTEIVRQEENNTIIKFATMARNGIPFNTGNYGDVIVVRKEMLKENQLKNILTQCDQILCGTNKTARDINQKMKEWFNFKTDQLNIGEKVICLMNNWAVYIDEDEKYSLVNGTTGYVMGNKMINEKDCLGMMDFKADISDDTCKGLLYDSQVFDTGEFKYNFHQDVCVMGDGTYQVKKNFSNKGAGESYEDFTKRMRELTLQKKDTIFTTEINFFNTAYCISVHKSQGSEYDNVVLFDEKKYFTDPEKWLYTGITRAKKKIIIIQ